MTQMLSTRTVCCKLALDTDAASALRATAEAFNAAASYCAQVAWEQHITNKNKLHHLVYGPTRINYGLGVQLACCARDRAAEEARFQRDVNHCISKKLVEKAKTERKALALEDLSHIRKRTDNCSRRSQRRLRASWAFRQLRGFIAYKAQREGVQVAYVEARDTSRTCAICGDCEKANRPDQAHFHCRNPVCGHTAAADTNAAVNIASRAARQTAYRAAPPTGGGASTSPPALAAGI